MPLRIIHTSDWQIRKVFRFVDDDTMGLLQNARLDAISRLGELAIEHAASHVLVAGDVYDVEALSDLALRQPIERMRAYPQITWHLLPGNHDPQRLFGLWDRLARNELPANIVLHTGNAPYLAESDRLAVLPAPLKYRSTLSDPTEHMDSAETPDSFYRIGLAHGSVTRFGSDDSANANYIDPGRATSARLDYLALGDWHGQKRISDRVWYSGTHEIDAFDVVDGGQALLVSFDAPGTMPRVEPLQVGRYRWHRETVQLSARADINALDSRLRALPEPLGQHLVYLTVEGALSLDDFEYFDACIRQALAAALCVLRIDDQSLLPQPRQEDLDRIETGGFVRAAADQLAELAADPANPQQEIAALALQRLYIEYRKLAGAES
ncbi:MAG: exonuclease SbcCD subunit D [Congregibacter sp.]